MCAASWSIPAPSPRWPKRKTGFWFLPSFSDPSLMAMGPGVDYRAGRGSCGPSLISIRIFRGRSWVPSPGSIVRISDVLRAQFILVLLGLVRDCRPVFRCCQMRRPGSTGTIGQRDNCTAAEIHRRDGREVCRLPRWRSPGRRAAGCRSSTHSTFRPSGKSATRRIAHGARKQFPPCASAKASPLHGRSKPGECFPKSRSSSPKSANRPARCRGLGTPSSRFLR